jgi:hypothetical protein
METQDFELRYKPCDMLVSDDDMLDIIRRTGSPWDRAKGFSRMKRDFCVIVSNEIDYAELCKVQSKLLDILNL